MILSYNEHTDGSAPGKHHGGFVAVLRTACAVAVLAGAVGSMALTLRAGRRNDSRLLLLLFAIWVLSPFVALAMTYVVSKRWSVPTQTTLYSVTLVITLASLSIYGDVVLGTPRAKPAFAFLIVPLLAWLLIGSVVPIAALISRKMSR